MAQACHPLKSIKDIIGNKVFGSLSQRSGSVIHSKIMQAASDHHDQIRKTVFGVSQNILHDSRPLDTRNSMFDPDTNLRHLAVALFLFGS